MLFFQYQPEIEGWDTETFKGNVKLICNSNECYEPKDGKVIDWLFKHASDDLNFFFNINFDFSAIMKPYITDKNGKQIREGKNIPIGKYLVSYINGKYFSIKHRTSKKYKTKRFFDISQFYRTGTHLRTLDAVASKELGMSKNDKALEINRRSIGETMGYFELHREKIAVYCKQDALLTKELAERRVNTVYELLGAIPKSWYSNASIAKAYIKLRHPREQYAYAKLIQKLPDKQQYLYFELIRNSYYGGLFYDAYLGNIGAVSELDINSAYPDAITKLKSIADADIRPITEYDPSADYSFYKVKMKYDFEFPFPYRQKSGSVYTIIYPHTPIPITTFTTGIELEYLLERGVKVEVLDGIGIYCKSQTPEFADYKELYEKRKQYKASGNEALQYMIKIVLNASYGVFAQSRGGFTSLTNFIYSSYITAMTRVKIYRKCDQIGWDKVRGIKTDAIIYRGNYRWSSDILGDFKQEFENEEVITYFTGLSIRNGKVDASRGFMSLTADDLLKAEGVTLKIREKPRPVKLKEGIIQKRVQDIADFKESERELHLHSNLAKYVLDTENLNFQYMAKKPLQTEQLLVSDNTAEKKPMKEEYKALMQTASKSREITVTVPEILEEKQDINEGKMYDKLKRIGHSKTFRERERLKRFFKSKFALKHWKFSIIISKKV